MPKNTTIAPDEARQATVALRKFYIAGKRSLGRLRRLQKTSDAYRFGSKQEFLKREAVTEGYNHYTMKKAWRIAQEYEEDDIKQLCAFVEEHSARFGPTHLLRLLTVKDRRRRNALTLKAIKRQWSVTQLETAILRLHRRRPEVGRKPRIPHDLAQLRLVLEGLCLKWVRWCQTAQPMLPEELRDLVNKATKAVAAVKEAASTKPAKPTTHKRQKA